MSGTTPAASQANMRPGAAEAGEDFVEDQQQLVAVGQPRAAAAAPAASWKRMPPAPCTSGSTMMPAISSACRSSSASSAASLASSRGRSSDELLGQEAGEQRVHAVLRIADRHRAGGVAVIAAAGRRRTACAPRTAPVEPELHRHLHGDLDRHRAGVRRRTRGRDRRAAARPAAAPASAPARAPARRTSHAASLQAAARPPRGYADGCSRGRRSTTRRCRRSARGRRRARCGSHACARPAAAARGLHLRVGQPDMVQAGLVPACGRCSGSRWHSELPFASLRAILPGAQARCSTGMRHSTNSRHGKLASSSAQPAPRAGRDRPGRRHLGRCATAGGCCRSAATTTST